MRLSGIIYLVVCAYWLYNFIDKEDRNWQIKPYISNNILDDIKLLALEHSAILLTCIKTIISLENQFSIFLKVVVLHKFYCILN